MGEFRPGVPLNLAVQLRDRLGLVAAVETGTHVGDSAAQLASVFDKVWTIELSEQFYNAARDKYQSASTITFVHGDSELELVPIAGALSGPALFWLDGHWSGGATAGSNKECPVVAEIAAIDESPHGSGSAILIDDARLFFGPPGPPHKPEHWPSFVEVADHLRARHSRYVTALEDVVIAVPVDAREAVDRYWLEVQATDQRRQGSRVRRPGRRYRRVPRRK